MSVSVLRNNQQRFGNRCVPKPGHPSTSAGGDSGVDASGNCRDFSKGGNWGGPRGRAGASKWQQNANANTRLLRRGRLNNNEGGGSVGKRTYSNSESETYFNLNNGNRQQPMNRQQFFGGSNLPPTNLTRNRKRPRFSMDSTMTNNGNNNIKPSNKFKPRGTGGKKVELAENKDNKKDPLGGNAQQPKAPNNTTQFLITDREERESADRDMDFSSAMALDSNIGADTECTSSEDDHHRRPRSNTANASCLRSAVLSGLEQSDAEDVADDIDDPEFSAVYDDCYFERIKSLPRDQVNREMLEAQKSNLHLSERICLLKCENIRLKKLLERNGINSRGQTTIELASFGGHSATQAAFETNVEQSNLNKPSNSPM